MELLDVFANYNYPNEIGPGVYDIHSPRIPSINEITNLIKKARHWAETKKALLIMINSAKEIRKEYAVLQ